MTDKDLYRILDANFNRSREGLRVCEDLARFAWNSQAITGELKSIRHAVSHIIKTAPGMASRLCLTRDVKRDIGREMEAGHEMARVDCADIFSANIQRVKESLRVLEEFFKLIEKKNSRKLAALRFRIYEVEKNARKRHYKIR